MRNQELDSQLDQYLHPLLPLGAELSRKLSDGAFKTGISLSTSEGLLLGFLARAHGGQKWVEIGTLTGFSALCLVQGMGELGCLWTIEKDPSMALAATQVFKEAGVESRIRLIQGDAAEKLNSISFEGPFDGLFVDGAKNQYGIAISWAQKNIRSGGMIVLDNVFLSGEVFSGTPEGKWTQTSRERMLQIIQEMLDPRLYFSTLLPTREGMLLAIKH